MRLQHNGPYRSTALAQAVAADQVNMASFLAGEGGSISGMGWWGAILLGIIGLVRCRHWGLRRPWLLG